MTETHQEEQLKLSLEPASLADGTAEERASFGRLSIVVNGRTMTKRVALASSLSDLAALAGKSDGVIGRPGLGRNASPKGDGFRGASDESQSGPYVSGYHLAEWFVRNWWRLAYEPSLTDDSEDSDETPMGWDFAHWMSTIGEGYVWPNIRLVSDGFQVSVGSFPSEDPYVKAFRHVGADKPELITLECLQDATRKWIDDVLHMLNEARAKNTELHRLWSALLDDIDRPEVSVQRRIEAMLGFDPDEANTAVRKSVADVGRLGCDAVAELAADANTRRSQVVAASDLERSGKVVGFDGCVEDVVEPHPNFPVPAWGTCEAWRVGVAAAHAVRRSVGLNGQPVDTPMLASMAGTSESVIHKQDRTGETISFALDDGGSGSSRIVMRPKWKTGRRFDLARLIADRLFDNSIGDPLLPATQAYTYRQKAQRAFAAELLAPISAVDDFLNGDRSDARCNDAAEYFDVSRVAIDSLLRNNHRL